MIFLNFFLNLGKGTRYKESAVNALMYPLSPNLIQDLMEIQMVSYPKLEGIFSPLILHSFSQSNNRDIIAFTINSL
jgi:hypothetical protein